MPSGIAMLPASIPEPVKKRDRHKVWLVEQGLMRMVEEGDLPFHGFGICRRAVSSRSTASWGVLP